MSYDFGMHTDLGNGKIHLSYNKNYTYNVSPMFCEAFGNNGINFIEEKTGKECLVKLKQGLSDMKNNKEKYEVMNPDSGWGCYDGAVEVIEILIKWAKEAPSAKFHIY